MTPVEIHKGIRSFLRGQGGDRFTSAWLATTGDIGRDYLLHLLILPSVRGRRRALVEYLVVTYLYDAVVEERLSADAKAHPDPRVRTIRENTLKGFVAARFTKPPASSSEEGRN